MKVDIQQSQTLWEDFLNGSELAYAQLYQLYAKPMYRYGLLVSRNLDEIEDAIHDIFVKLHSDRKKLPLVDNPKGYLFISLRNRLLNTNSARKEVPLNIDIVEAFYTKNIEKNIEDTIIDREEESHKAKLLKHLQELLTDKEKEAIYYRYNELLPYSDIAELMGIKVQSAKNLVQKSLNKMRAKTDIPIHLVIIILSNLFSNN